MKTYMINLPEPVAWFANYGGNVYTEAQLKQAVRDALDAQDVTELVEALQLFAYALPLDKSTVKTCYAVTNQMRDAAHAALSKYKGAK